MTRALQPAGKLRISDAELRRAEAAESDSPVLDVEIADYAVRSAGVLYSSPDRPEVSTFDYVRDPALAREVAERFIHQQLRDRQPRRVFDDVDVTEFGDSFSRRMSASAPAPPARRTAPEGSYDRASALAWWAGVCKRLAGVLKSTEPERDYMHASRCQQCNRPILADRRVFPTALIGAATCDACWPAFVPKFVDVGARDTYWYAACLIGLDPDSAVTRADALAADALASVVGADQLFELADACAAVGLTFGSESDAAAEWYRRVVYVCRNRNTPVTSRLSTQLLRVDGR